MESTEAIKLKQLDFQLYSDIFSGFVSTYSFASFVNDIGSNFTNFFKYCLLDINFELILKTESVCNIEKTNEIYYNSMLKPNAWFLDMLDTKTDNIYKYNSNETYINDVDLFILDTGVYTLHKEFDADQVVELDPTFTNINLQHPHGTGCASIAAGRFYGSSKHVKIYSFPVCRYGGQCSQSDIEKGLQAVILHLMQRREESTRKRTVINLSVGSDLNTNVMNTSLGIYYDGLFRTIENLGGIVVTSAGNGNEDACTWLYSFSEYVISVGSVTQRYIRAPSSNWGKCVDVYSFGDSVPLAYSISDPFNIQLKSGTSFSSPLVAGIIINLLQHDISLSRMQILSLLASKTKGQNLIVAEFQCEHIKPKCCNSIYINTRLQAYCKNLTVNQCDRNCVITDC